MKEITDAVDEMTREVSGLREELPQWLKQIHNESSSRIEVNAGGLGVWISATCCAGMLGIGIFSAIVIVDQQRQIADLQHYLSAIYMQAPHLKPEEQSNGDNHNPDTTTTSQP